MDPKRDDEVFDNPQFAPGADEKPRADVPAAMPAGARTLELSPVIPPAARREPEPAQHASTLKLLLIAIGSFLLGVVCTWALMRSPAPPRSVPAPVVATAPAATMNEVAVPIPPPLAPRVSAPTRVDAESPQHARHDIKAELAPHHPAPTGSGVLRTYESGDLTAALRVAQADHADELLQKMTALQKALDAATSAARAHDVGRELSQLESAMQLDAAIDRDPGPLRARIRDRLVDATIAAGDRALAQHDAQSAVARYQRALELAPNKPGLRRKLDRAEDH